MTAVGAIDPTTGGLLAPPDDAATPPDTDVLQVQLVVKDDARGTLTAQLQDAITAGELEVTMDGASTLTLTVFDPDQLLMRAKAFAGTRAQVKVDGYAFTMVRAEKRGDSVTLTFEDAVVNQLRVKHGAAKKYRDKVTRAEFAKGMVREVSAAIAFDAPELKTRQPIARGTTSTAKASSSRGTLGNAKLRVKTGPTTTKVMDHTQRRNVEAMLRYVDDLYPNAPTKARQALLCAAEQESEYYNPRQVTFDGSYGILQGRMIEGHRLADLMNIGYNVRVFMGGSPAPKKWQNGWTSRGGAVELTRKHPGWTAGQIAQAVEGSAYPDRYDLSRARATAILRAWSGGSATATTATAKGSNRYAFKREKTETVWDALKRLADEVKWRTYVVGGRVQFVSEDYLLTSPTRLVVSEADAAVYELDYALDSGRTVTEVALTVHAARWTVTPGMLVQVTGTGLADGKYLVSSARRSLFDTTVEATLKSKTAKLPEPSADGGKTVSPTTDKASQRDKAVAAAKRALKLDRDKNYYNYSQAGGPMPTLWRKQKSTERLDCSWFVTLCYKDAGATDPNGGHYKNGGYTGTLMSHGTKVSTAKPGDLIFYGAAPGRHVDMYVGDGNIIGFGSNPVKTHKVTPGYSEIRSYLPK